MLVLRKPTLADKIEIETCYKQSASLHQPWCYPPENFDDYLGQEGRYFLCLTSTGNIVGTFNISGIIRGFFQSGYLGYEAFSPHQNNGYMRLGIKLLLDEAFNHLKLHRLEANIQPDNIASIKLVSAAGFTKEGFSKSYLNVGGLGWKDHERWAILASERSDKQSWNTQSNKQI